MRAIGQAMERLAARRSPRPGAAAVGVAGLVWAGFSLALFLSGHRPTMTLLPVAPESHYAAQAAFIVPLLFLQWLVASLAGNGVARALGGSGDLRATASPIGVSLAVPLLATFLLPDVVVFLVAGFEALGPLFRFAAALTFLAALLLATFAVRATHRVTTGRAFLAAAAAVIAQALVGGPLVR